MLEFYDRNRPRKPEEGDKSALLSLIKIIYIYIFLTQLDLYWIGIS